MKVIQTWVFRRCTLPLALTPTLNPIRPTTPPDPRRPMKRRKLCAHYSPRLTGVRSVVISGQTHCSHCSHCGHFLVWPFRSLICGLLVTSSRKETKRHRLNRVLYTCKIRVNIANLYLFVINATRPGILLLLYDVCDALKIAFTQDFQSPSSSFAILLPNQNKHTLRQKILVWRRNNFIFVTYNKVGQKRTLKW